MTTGVQPRFHHAFPVFDLQATRRFYGEVLGCVEGRKKESLQAADFDFFGHHLVAHLVADDRVQVHKKASEGLNVACRHFGLVLAWPQWQELADRLVTAGVDFIVEPRVLHEGEPQEEAFMMLTDPSGNAIEFKTFRNLDYLFGKERNDS